MKTFFTCCLLTISVLPCAEAQIPNPDFQPNVQHSVHKGKLALYKDANPKSKVVAEIGSLEEVALFYDAQFRAAKNTKYENITGKWQKASYQGKMGYVFSGFVSPLPVPKMTDGTVATDLAAFAKNQFKTTKTSADKVQAWSPQFDKFFDTDSTTTTFDNGWMLIEKKNERLGYTSLVIPNTTVEAVLLWSQFFSLESQYFDYVKPQKEKTVAIDEFGLRYFFDFKYDAEKRLSYLKTTRGSEGGTVMVILEYNKNKQVCLTLIDDFM